MKRITAAAMVMAIILICCACGQTGGDADSVSEWTLIAGGQKNDGPSETEEEESGNGLISIEGVYVNTQFSTEYQYLIYVIYTITNDSEEEISVPQADPESDVDSAASLRIGSSIYGDLYPVNEWMRESLEGRGKISSAGDGSVIPGGSTTRMISCFQVDTEDLDEETTMKLVFQSGTTTLSATAAAAELQRVAGTEQLFEKIG